MAFAAAPNIGSGVVSQMVEPAAALVATATSAPPLPTALHPSSPIPNNPIFTSIGDTNINPETAAMAATPPPTPAPPTRALNSAARAGVAAVFSVVAMTILVLIIALRRRRRLTFSGSDRNSRATNKDLVLKRHLQDLAKGRHCLAGHYILHSPKEILSDENAFIVPASLAASQDDDGDDDELDVLFYTDTAAFERERAVLSSPEWLPFVTALRAALPSAHNKPLLFANGQPLPPAVVVTHGESVRDWALAEGGDPLLVAQTLFQLATLLQKVHDKGLVHRDIRPESLRWLPHQLEWVLINFGFSAADGAPWPGDLNCVHTYSMCVNCSACLPSTLPQRMPIFLPGATVSV